MKDMVVSSSSLIDEYFRICKAHPDRLVVIQVGSFYEAYGDESGLLGSAKILSRVLNIHLTRKNGKAEISDKNPYMCGFPTYTLPKHLTKLNDEGYVVMVLSQDAENPKSRNLTGTYTNNMRMHFEDEEDVREQHVFSLMIEQYRVRVNRIDTIRYLIAMVQLETHTGRIFLLETETGEPGRVLDDLLLRFHIEEAVISYRDCDPDVLQMFVGFFSQRCSIQQDDSFLPSPEILFWFEKVYGPGEDHLISTGLDRHPLASETVARLFRFVDGHDPLLIRHLKPPVFLAPEEGMAFNRDALSELNILGVCEKRSHRVVQNRIHSVFSMLSQHMDVMGKRYFQRMLMSPTRDAGILEERYRLLEYCIQQLPSISTTSLPPVDGERRLLCWKRGKLSTRLLGGWLLDLRRLSREIMPSWPIFFSEIQERVEHALSQIEQHWDLEAMACGCEFFSSRLPSEAMDLYEKLRETESQIRGYATNGKIVAEDNRFYLHFSPKAWKTHQKNEEGLYVIQETRSLIKCSHPRIDSLSATYQTLLSQKNRWHKKFFEDSSSFLLETFGGVLEETNERLARYYCHLSLASWFQKRGYTRPNLVSDPGKIAVVEMRHPIIEYIDPDLLFVPMNISLENSGILLYGINSSGKSTLLKALGICVWMAQCGLFVPCKEMTYSPFDHLLTKIGTVDNLFRGQSTFVAEMSELNYILRRATPRSLVMCDELTSGTETRSATGIVAAALFSLLREAIPFLFTTHLHPIAQLPEIAQHPRLRVGHISIDEIEKERLLIRDIRLRYNRRILDGCGGDTYGVEIASAIGLPKEFIERASLFRERIQLRVSASSSTSPPSHSRYNRKMFMTACFLCGGKEDLHTHHITPQKEFEENSIHHKHGKYNLITLCRECHEKTHHPLEE